MAHQGHFPAIDVLQSISRLEGQLLDGPERALQMRLRTLLATHAKYREMVDMGLYKSGANPTLDEALRRMPAVQSFLRQGLAEHSSPTDANRALTALLAEGH